MTQAGAAPIPPSSWKRLTVSGLRWNFLASFLKQLLNFVIGVILARLLSPSDFGLVGMVAVFTGFASVFMGQGFGAAIIQRQDLDGRHLDSIFWMNAFLDDCCAT